MVISQILLNFSDFHFFYNAIHGNCYVFNSGWNKSLEIRRSYETGRRSGKI